VLIFGGESSLFQFALQKYIYQNILKYNIASYCVRALSMVFKIEGGKFSEGV
jgi:hypothetical protein